MLSLKRINPEIKAACGLILLIPLLLIFWDTSLIIIMRTFHARNAGNFLFAFILDPFMRFVSHGSTLVTVALAVCLLGKWRNEKAYRVGKALVVGYLSSGLAVQILKHLIGRARPRISDAVVFIGPTLKSGYDSFPSGHTAVAFCFASILSEKFPKHRGMFYIFAAAVALARVEGTSHFPSDVMAGAALGILTARLIAYVGKTVSSEQAATAEE